jgi:hypothetical protein
MVLTVNGVSQTFRDITGWAVSSGQFSSNLLWRGTTEFFQHGVTTGTYYGIGLSGYQHMKDACGAGAELSMSRIFTVRREFL